MKQHYKVSTQKGEQ